MIMGKKAHTVYNSDVSSEFIFYNYIFRPTHFQSVHILVLLIVYKPAAKVHLQLFLSKMT